MNDATLPLPELFWKPWPTSPPVPVTFCPVYSTEDTWENPRVFHRKYIFKWWRFHGRWVIGGCFPYIHGLYTSPVVVWDFFHQWYIYVCFLLAGAVDHFNMMQSISHRSSIDFYIKRHPI